MSISALLHFSYLVFHIAISFSSTEIVFDICRKRREMEEEKDLYVVI